MPNTLCRPDEAFIINIAMRFGTGDLNPHTFLYPTLYPYGLFAAYLLYYLFGRLIGRFSGVDAFITEYHLDPTTFFLIDRLIVSILGTATIVLTYRVCRRFFDTTTALIASLFMSVAFLHVRDSHFGVTDVPLTFFVMLALLAIVRTRSTRSIGAYVAAGIAIGLAASTKHSGALMILPALAAHALNVREAGGGPVRVVLDRRPWLLGAAVAVTFVMATPFAVLDWPTFLGDLRLQRGLLGGTLYAFVGRGWERHLSFTLLHGLGWPLLAASLTGLLWVIVADFRKAIVVTSFPIVYFALFGSGLLAMSRYAVPLVPFLCITAGYFCTAAVSAVGSALDTRRRAIAMVLLTAAIAAPSFYSSVRFDRILRQRDSRVVAVEWVERHVPPASSIFQAASPYGRLQLFPTKAMLEKEIEQTKELGGQGAGPSAKIAYASTTGTVGYEEWFHDSEQGFLRAAKPIDSLPDYIIVEQGPFARYRSEPSDLLRIQYELQGSIPGLAMAESIDRFDLQDLFYVPLAGFDDVERPGPAFKIYRRRD